MWFMVTDLIADAPRVVWGGGGWGYVMKEFKVPLISSNGKGAVLWEAKSNPVITFR